MIDKLAELIQLAKAVEQCIPEYDEIGRNMAFAHFLINNGVVVQEWISVKDRLPKQHEKVLTYRRSLCDEYAKTTIEYMFLYNGEVGWTGDVNTWKTVVTHWMPLPEPPKGE